MKINMILSIACVVAAGLSPALADVSKVSDRLPGKYRLTYEGTFLTLRANKTYYPDGSYESVGTARVLGIKKKLIHRGKWKLEKGELVYILSESSTPSEAPVGVPLRFKVLSHDGKTMRYRDEKRDKNYSETRLGDAKNLKR